MNSDMDWRPIVCPACKGKDLSLRETRTVSVFYRQRPDGPPSNDLCRIVHQSDESCLYEYDSRAHYLDDIQAQCNMCGLKWVITDCKRMEDYRPPPETPAPATRKIRAAEVTADITGGMNDADLMEKYDLTARQLELLLQQLVSKGILTQEQIDERLNLTGTAVTKAFDETRKSIEELDYVGGPAPGPTQSTPDPAPKSAARDPMDQEPRPGGPSKISVNEFVADVLSGMSDLELLAKYSLNPKQLQFVFQRLLDLGYISSAELDDRAQIADTSVTRAFMEVYQSLQELED